VHGTPLLYAPSRGQHACQDITCRYAHGLEPNLDDLDRYVLEQGEDFWDLLLRHERERLAPRPLPWAPEELNGSPRQEDL
jgi:hypothetical protein